MICEAITALLGIYPKNTKKKTKKQKTKKKKKLLLKDVSTSVWDNLRNPLGLHQWVHKAQRNNIVKIILTTEFG